MHSRDVPKDSVAHDTNSSPLTWDLNEPTPEMWDMFLRRVDIVEGVITSLQANMRELNGKGPLSITNMSFLDEVISNPHTPRGPIDEFLRDLEED
ncbi:hypothetical protein HAX54_049808 [Datura stramonium]|uniref:Uncharacterized protein n=1 Tax=Datura stramonium TaxID=4076 RepID=A0ABS8SWB4_DATST|nr:hypothetical protein [Datura stramonium]